MRLQYPICARQNDCPTPLPKIPNHRDRPRVKSIPKKMIHQKYEYVQEPPNRQLIGYEFHSLGNQDSTKKRSGSLRSPISQRCDDQASYPIGGTGVPASAAATSMRCYCHALYTRIFTCGLSACAMQANVPTQPVGTQIRLPECSALGRVHDCHDAVLRGLEPALPKPLSKLISLSRSPFTSRVDDIR